MKRSIVFLFAAVLLAVSSSAQTPATSITRLAWDQPAPSLATARAYEYSVLIDGANRAQPQGVTCDVPVNASGFFCRGQLPAMTPGDHTIELITTDVASVPGSRIESFKSAPLAIRYVAAPSAGVNLRTE